MNNMEDFHVIIKFGKGIPGEVQGVVMLHLEKELRELGYEAEVYKDTMADDSKLRLVMTQEQREKL